MIDLLETLNAKQERDISKRANYLSDGASLRNIDLIHFEINLIDYRWCNEVERSTNQVT